MEREHLAHQMANAIAVIEYLDKKADRDALENYVLEDQKTNLQVKLAQYDALAKQDQE